MRMIRCRCCGEKKEEGKFKAVRKWWTRSPYCLDCRTLYKSPQPITSFVRDYKLRKGCASCLLKRPGWKGNDYVLEYKREFKYLDTSVVLSRWLTRLTLEEVKIELARMRVFCRRCSAARMPRHFKNPYRGRKLKSWDEVFAAMERRKKGEEERAKRELTTGSGDNIMGGESGPNSAGECPVRTGAGESDTSPASQTSPEVKSCI